MVCKAYLALIEHGVPGQVYNVCSGQPFALQHVIDTLEQLTGHSMAIKVNPAFVRVNEVHRLCGNPDKLKVLFKHKGVTFNTPGLDQTLDWMLSEALD
jgi:nucleoside-diphosphate-sugar epimerase